jgi:hypothetical protein
MDCRSPESGGTLPRVEEACATAMPSPADTESVMQATSMAKAIKPPSVPFACIRSRIFGDSPDTFRIDAAGLDAKTCVLLRSVAAIANPPRRSGSRSGRFARPASPPIDRRFRRESLNHPFG